MIKGKICSHGKEECSLSQTQLSIYINELTVQLELSATLRLNLEDRKVKFLLLPSPAAQELQLYLDLLDKCC